MRATGKQPRKRVAARRWTREALAPYVWRAALPTPWLRERFYTAGFFDLRAIAEAAEAAAGMCPGRPSSSRTGAEIIRRLSVVPVDHLREISVRAMSYSTYSTYSGPPLPLPLPLAAARHPGRKDFRRDHALLTAYEVADSVLAWHRTLSLLLPHSSPPLDEALPVRLGGGGGRHRVFRATLDTAASASASATTTTTISIRGAWQRQCAALLPASASASSGPRSGARTGADSMPPDIAAAIAEATAEVLGRPYPHTPRLVFRVRGADRAAGGGGGGGGEGFLQTVVLTASASHPLRYTNDQLHLELEADERRRLCEWVPTVLARRIVRRCSSSSSSGTVALPEALIRYIATFIVADPRCGEGRGRGAPIPIRV